jgi:predicted amidophosphoribosyltransferase
MVYDIPKGVEKKCCNKCRHEWIPNIDNPLFCPKCRKRLWRDGLSNINKEAEDNILIPPEEF